MKMPPLKYGSQAWDIVDAECNLVKVTPQGVPHGSMIPGELMFYMLSLDTNPQDAPANKTAPPSLP